MKIRTIDVSGWNGAIRGMRNPLESWDKSDSEIEYESWHDMSGGKYKIGNNDLTLMQKLIKGGSEHSKFMRMIHVQADVDMPRYWWSEMDTYHFNVKNSCSTMHKLLNRNTPITTDMFVTCDEDKDISDIVIARLESLRIQYLNSSNQKDKDYLLLRAKRLLPEGFLQLRMFDTNYSELRNMYFQRRNHRLKEEWVEIFCSWVESLPYAKELICHE